MKVQFFYGTVGWNRIQFYTTVTKAAKRKIYFPPLVTIASLV